MSHEWNWKRTCGQSILQMIALQIDSRLKLFEDTFILITRGENDQSCDQSCRGGIAGKLFMLAVEAEKGGVNQEVFGFICYL